MINGFMQRRQIFQKIKYSKLNSRAQENYNFQKIASAMADFGYYLIRLSNDWNGADAIAVHESGNKSPLFIQIKSRLSVGKKYLGKKIWIAFRENGRTFVFPHDHVFKKLIPRNSGAWKNGGRSWSHLTSESRKVLSRYELESSL